MPGPGSGRDREPDLLFKITFPEEIWGLMQLRHLKLPRIYLPDCPSGSVDKGRNLDFSNSQTISYLSPRCCTKEQLETLSFIFCFSCLPASAKAFPATLKKLKLRLTSLSWSYLDIIAELPNLEVLKLMHKACRGEGWHPNVRGFARLKLLLIEENHLKYRKATDDNFPVLERLVINY
ncbi:hypothetical protein T459_24570 [Capsicum annuum]|uniref:Uncharacterized protein n=1 Tax=Capsicum annuum TaxID=4072 RepID=A0A2G2YVZ8_CAPAN|nr:hypothetical protein T459_24570 [Capsicum annuum]